MQEATANASEMDSQVLACAKPDAILWQSLLCGDEWRKEVNSVTSTYDFPQLSLVAR